VAAINSVVSQAIGSALGIQSFSWRGVAAAAVTAGVVQAGSQLINAISGGTIDLSKAEAGSSNPSDTGRAGTAQSPGNNTMATVARNVIGILGAVAGSAVQNKGKVEWRSVAINAVGNSIGAVIVERYQQYQRDQQSIEISESITARKARETLAAMQAEQRGARQNVTSSADLSGLLGWQDPLKEITDRLLSLRRELDPFEDMTVLTGKSSNARTSANARSGVRIQPPSGSVISIQQNEGIRNSLNLAEDLLGFIPQITNQLDLIRGARPTELLKGDLDKLVTDIQRAGHNVEPKSVPLISAPGDDTVRMRIDAQLADIKEQLLRSFEDKRMVRTFGEGYKDLRFGHSKMDVFALERTVFSVQQSEINRSFTDYMKSMDAGQVFNPKDAGIFVDTRTRFALNNFYENEGLSIGAMRINKGFGPKHSYTIPDNLLGFNLVFETTLSPKNSTTEQIQKMFAALDGGTRIVILRPDWYKVPYQDRPTNQQDWARGSYIITPRALETQRNLNNQIFLKKKI
jgi:hypothetical protein